MTPWTCSACLTVGTRNAPQSTLLLEIHNLSSGRSDFDCPEGYHTGVVTREQSQSTTGIPESRFRQGTTADQETVRRRICRAHGQKKGGCFGAEVIFWFTDTCLQSRFAVVDLVPVAGTFSRRRWSARSVLMLCDASSPICFFFSSKRARPWQHVQSNMPNHRPAIVSWNTDCSAAPSSYWTGFFLDLFLRRLSALVFQR